MGLVVLPQKIFESQTLKSCVFYCRFGTLKPTWYLVTRTENSASRKCLKLDVEMSAFLCILSVNFVYFWKAKDDLVYLCTAVAYERGGI